VGALVRRVSAADLAGRLLGCGDGPASFNAEATRRGCDVTSCDPLYQWDAFAIEGRITETSEVVLEQTRRNQHEFVWTAFQSVDDLRRTRMAAMRDFLGDFPGGRRSGRYVDAALPTLPFRDDEFDLALSSHFLFVYSDQLGEAFHVAGVCELCRVATEVRIFPLLALGGQRSAFVGAVTAWAADAGWRVAIEQVPYEFQRGGNQMMRITREVSP
jgi:hypothetical protein